MKINYVIATYNGYTKRNYSTPSPEDTLKIHIEKIKKYKSIINQITIMKAKSDNYYKNYYNCLNVHEIDDIPVKIIDCDNYGYSMGQWLKAYELSKNNFDYYIFIEDDYCPNMINFDQILLDIYNKKFNSNIGLLCAVVEGTTEFNLRNNKYPLHWEGVVMTSKETLQKLYERWENNPLLWLNKINNKIDPKYNWNKLKKKYLGAYYQLAFSHMFTLSGIKHDHYLNEYYNDKLLQFSLWHDQLKNVSFYNNSSTRRKNYTLKDITECPIVPIQLSSVKSIKINAKNIINFSSYKKKIKCLACILFHNDEDLVLDQLEYLKYNKHDIIVFDHNSTDNTLKIVNENIKLVDKVYNIPGKINFKNNGVFEYISKILIKDYSKKYDWISFIESDEFLEGPDRSKSYYEHLIDVDKTQYDYLSFDNYVFWFTEKDGQNKSVRERMKYYCYKRKCGTRYYAWRAKLQNIRRFNHNKVNGKLFPTPFKTCHYEMRSIDQAEKKLKDRKGITKGSSNHHYNIMINKGVKNLLINSKELHYDDGSELIKDDKFDWSRIY